MCGQKHDKAFIANVSLNPKEFFDLKCLSVEDQDQLWNPEARPSSTGLSSCLSCQDI